MDTAPDPRQDLTAAQRIAIALGTAEPPHEDGVDDPHRAVAPEPALAGFGEEPLQDTPA